MNDEEIQQVFKEEFHSFFRCGYYSRGYYCEPTMAFTVIRCSSFMCCDMVIYQNQIKRKRGRALIRPSQN